MPGPVVCAGQTKSWDHFQPQKLIHNEVGANIFKRVHESMEFRQGYQDNSMDKEIVFLTNDSGNLNIHLQNLNIHLDPYLTLY